jgi:hypothetical protein
MTGKLGELYVPKGLALETARTVLECEHPMALNVALGCTNDCDYCYGSLAFKKKDWTTVRIAKKEVIDKFREDVEKKKPEGVFLSFATDPLNAEVLHYTMFISMILAKKGIPLAVLSKRGYGDVLLQSSTVRMGKTIVSLDAQFWQEHEHNTDIPLDRLWSLKMCNHPWISCEPYPTPNIFFQDAKNFLENIVRMVTPKLIIFGKWNYDKRANTIEAREFYRETVNTFTDFCKSNHIQLHVKSDTLKFIETGFIKRDENYKKVGKW